MDDGGACVCVAKRTHSGNEVFTYIYMWPFLSKLMWPWFLGV
jgi:hypothetical protein